MEVAMPVGPRNLSTMKKTLQARMDHLKVLAQTWIIYLLSFIHARKDSSYWFSGVSDVNVVMILVLLSRWGQASQAQRRRGRGG